MSKYIKAIDKNGKESLRRDFSDWDFRRCIALCMYGAKLITGERLQKEFFETKDLQYFAANFNEEDTDSNIEDVIVNLSSQESEYVIMNLERDENLLPIGSSVKVPTHVTDKLSNEELRNFTDSLKALTKNTVSTEMLMREFLPVSFTKEIVNWCTSDDVPQKGKLPEILNMGAINLILDMKKQNELGQKDSALTDSMEMWAYGSPLEFASFSAVLMEIVQNDGRYKMG